MKTQKNYHVQSADMAAVISLKQQKLPTPILIDNKIIFTFEEDISGALSSFYKNEPLPIADYIQRLRMCRSMIFNEKTKHKG
jgi:hypothetical protein